jgi:hypothetical protein
MHVDSIHIALDEIGTEAFRATSGQFQGHVDFIGFYRLPLGGCPPLRESIQSGFNIALGLWISDKSQPT